MDSVDESSLNKELGCWEPGRKATKEEVFVGVPKTSGCVKCQCIVFVRTNGKLSPVLSALRSGFLWGRRRRTHPRMLKCLRVRF